MKHLVKFLDIRVFIFLGIAVFLMAIVGSSLMKVYKNRMEIEAEISDMEQKIATLKEENAKFENILKDGVASPAYLEKEARRRLNLKKPGEKMVIIVSQTTEENQESGIKNQENSEEDNSQTSWFSKFIKLFLP